MKMHTGLGPLIATGTSATPTDTICPINLHQKQHTVTVIMFKTLLTEQLEPKRLNTKPFHSGHFKIFLDQPFTTFKALHHPWQQGQPHLLTKIKDFVLFLLRVALRSFLSLG